MVAVMLYIRFLYTVCLVSTKTEVDKIKKDKIIYTHQNQEGIKHMTSQQLWSSLNC